MSVADRSRRFVVVAVLAVAVTCVGCAEVPAPEQTRPNVLLIVVDTLRVDRLGCYGAERETSPAVDELAAGAVRFERAYSTAPWTIPSVASMFSGLYPGSHAMNSFGLQLPDEVRTLAEVVQDAGYRTAGVVSHVAVDSSHNFDQGFEIYLESEAQGHQHVSTDGVTRQALELMDHLAGVDAPFLLFVHYFDPHYNYMRHAEFDFAAASAGRLDGSQPMRELLRMAPEMTDAEVGFLRDLYDGEIRYTDRGIGQLLERLDELGLRDDTIVVLTADHGEEFLDHGSLGHTGSLYEELLHVPLIIRDPGRRGRGPTGVTRPVSLVSLMPTILDLTGLDYDPGQFQGSSLETLLDGDRPGGQSPLFAEVDFVPLRKGRLVGEVHKKAVIGERFKLIRDDPSGKLELYDLVADPHEKADLAESDSAQLARLQEVLARALETTRSGALTPQPRVVDDPELERLKALGYADD